MATKVQKSRRKVRLSRALGIALTPKAVKYLERRPYAPGDHGKGMRGKDSDYKIRLKEKQRLREQYALKEKQLRAAYDEAKTKHGMTGDVMIESLETRLDALVLRAGFARTIAQARQAVVHRHITVDGKILDKPSAKVKPGQIVAVKPKSQGLTPFYIAAQGAHAAVLPAVPEYLDVQLTKLSFELKRAPKRVEVPIICEVNLVVEYYAR